MNILIVGFGRMGVSHALQILGLIKSKEPDCSIFIADPSFFSRIVARILIKNVSVKFISKSTLESIPDNYFEYAVDASPPINRDEKVSLLSRISKFFLIEKPVLSRLPKNGMSGYVLQHNPLIKILKSKIDRTFNKIDIELYTNLTFENQSSWRAGKHGGVVNEFLGHMLSVPFAVISDLNRFDISKVTETDKSIDIDLASSNISINLILKYAQNVRKTSYRWQFKNSNNLMIEYDNYSIKNIIGGNMEDMISLPLIGASCDFYLRGFDFSNQITSLINGNGDVMTSEQLSHIDDLIDRISI